MDPELLRLRLEEDEDDECDECDEKGNEKLQTGLTMRLLKQRIIIMAGEVNKALADRVNSQLLVLDGEDSEAAISLYIDSGGGDADAGFAMYDMIRFVKAPVRTVSTGLCASAAVLVLLGAEKTMRYALPNSRFLIHQPSTQVRGYVADIQIEASEILKIRDKGNQLIADATGRPVKKVEEDTKRNYWMSAEEAVEYGLIGRVAASRTDLD